MPKQGGKCARSSQIKRNMLVVRISDEHQKILQESCEYYGLNKTQYIELLLSLPVTLTDNALLGTPIILCRRQVREIGVELRRQGVNINQAAHALNIIGNRYLETKDKSTSAARIVELLIETNELLNEAKARQAEILKRLEKIDPQTVAYLPKNLDLLAKPDHHI